MRKPCCQDPDNLKPQETGREDEDVLVCQVCGRKHTRLTVDSGKYTITGQDVTWWRTYSFAPEWFADALDEARTGQDHNSRRREILFSVCFVESYLFEWVRDDILNRQFDKLTNYIPYGDRRGILKRWNEVLKNLRNDGLISAVPDFSDSHWQDFRTLVDYRNGLVHAEASRPEKHPQSEKEKPLPSKDVLSQLTAGWGVRIVAELVRRLHAAVGTATPRWLMDP